MYQKHCLRAIFSAAHLAAAGALFLSHALPAMASDAWADAVESYAPGSNADIGYKLPSTALGSPERITGEVPNGPFDFPAAVTPFSPAYQPHEVVSIGAGGHLTVHFDEPITNGPSHPYGADLIIFGNGFFTDTAPDYNGTVSGILQEGDFSVSVSQDGLTYFTLPGLHQDGLFPSLGYLDLPGPYSSPGSVLSDFRKPVNPSLTLSSFIGKSWSEIMALYDGSGGGLPLDIASSGLTEVYYVRLDVAADAETSPDIDAFATVPEPGGAAALLIFVLGVAFRRG